MKVKKLDSRTRAAWKRKATICNIWINLGNPNPFVGEGVDETAHRIAARLKIPIAVGMGKSPDQVISWVKENQPRLLATAKQRQRQKRVQPET